MKRTTVILIVGIIVAALALSAVYAQQGSRRGQGARYGRTGQPCPYGYQQPGAAQAGWWTTAQPKTPEQKAFVDEVKRLHEQIRVKQLDLAKLQANKAPASQTAAVQKDIDSLRARLHDVMYKNRALRQQMAPAGKGRGMGQGQGYGRGRCGMRQGQGMGPGQGMRQGMGGRGTGICPYTQPQR